jgi:hypothetical protein
MTQRTIVARSRYGHVVECDPVLVERARRAIRQRRDYETEVRLAA